jgi:hypothetical protein
MSVVIREPRGALTRLSDSASSVSASRFSLGAIREPIMYDAGMYLETGSEVAASGNYCKVCIAPFPAFTLSSKKADTFCTENL